MVSKVMPQHVRYSAGLVVSLALAATGCSEDVIIQSPGSSSSPSAAAAPFALSSAPADIPPPVAFQEDDFLENDRSRDPFRSFQDLFLERSDRKSWQHAKVIRPDLPLDELRLIGVVTGIVPAKAMVVDPAGKGHVIQRNDLVGKAERVQGGGGAGEFEINWRVDRIRESDVVFVREDPSNPDVPSATRVLSLRNEQEENAER